ncbi:eukaryotic translation initiation factor 3 subunit L-like [Pyrus ussuriensis x Pyrus communis]|uniref:Eukaryotic translation initiation factor 3 subunit L-like n=1 Tax=Pyrus ussuriensis x Pyrus communis TaxID=2448454 RepID=A0A5N5HS46_9ROSA|nr:eukaryotic translation initiation factor 3 subunit L-like [Pyrus ussuriensis x Pyrus communis]
MVVRCGLAFLVELAGVAMVMLGLALLVELTEFTKERDMDAAASIVLSPALQVLFDRLASPLLQKASDLLGYNDNFQSLQHALVRAQATLEVAEEQQFTNRAARLWLLDLKNADAYRLQLKLFLYEVKQQQLLSGVRTFLKVYSSISVGKLASYMEVDEAKLRTILLTYKHKTHSVDTEGKVISNADVDFYIDDDLISVVESKPAKRYGDYFLRQVVKLEGVINDMDRVKLD